MRLRMMVAVALVAFSPWAFAQADKDAGQNSTVDADDSTIRIPENDPIITIDAVGLGEIIEEVMEAVERALEGGQFALNSALKYPRSLCPMNRGCCSHTSPTNSSMESGANSQSIVNLLIFFLNSRINLSGSLISLV